MSTQAHVKEKCAHCGAAPTPHAVLWFDTAASLYFDRPLRVIFKPFVILLTPFVRWLTNAGLHAFFSVSSFIGLVSFAGEHEVTELHRKEVMFLEAKRRGIRMQIISFRKKEVSFARAFLPHRSYHTWHYFEHLPIPPWKDSPLWQNLDNKIELKELFKKHDIRVPRGAAFVSLKSASRFFAKLHVPVIVKPLEGSRARHTRVRVTEEEDFKEAFRCAKEICPNVLVEEFIEGDVHRLTCVDGKLIAAMRFVRPSIIADGVRNADQLREMYNENITSPQIHPVAKNSLFEVTLAHQGLRTDSIPPSGTIIRLADFSERTNGGYNEDVTDRIPQAVRSYIERAAAVSGLSLVGFDVISTDISDTEDLPIFLEANTAPFIEIHHEPTVGKERNVARAVWDLWLPNDRKKESD